MTSIQKIDRPRPLWILGAFLALALSACGGGSSDTDGPSGNPNDKSGCLDRYDSIKASMSDAQISAILGEPTSRTFDGEAKDGKLLGMGWDSKSYAAGIKCSFLVGMDKKGAYSKGVTSAAFPARSTLLRGYVPY